MSHRTLVPLSEEVLSELDDFLLSDACGADCLAIDAAHGYLTAMVILPGERNDTQWLSGLWGSPSFIDSAQEERIKALMVRLIDDICNTLAQQREFEPLVVETEEEGEWVESYEGWCFGFMLALELHSELWQDLPKERQGLLAPMAQLALQDSEEEEPMSDDEYLQWVELIPGAVSGLYGYWHAA